jgi:ribose transport system ATP-binding protein
VPMLEIAGVSKAFGGAAALRGVSLTVEKGEIHGLVGQNGSGKSTLVKVLAGVHSPDSGSLTVRGQAVPLPLHPGRAHRLGLCFVHQDLGLVPEMSVIENLRLGHFATRGSAFVSWRRERRRAMETFRRFGTELEPDTLVRELPMAQRAYLAIVRALSELEEAEQSSNEGGAVLVLDEPTVSLPASDKEMLFNTVRRAADRGHSAIFISHYLEDVLALTHRLTVLRDGEVVGVHQADTIKVEDLIASITGRARLHGAALPPTDVLTRNETAGAAVGDEIVVSDLAGGVLSCVQLRLRPGEIVGLTGLLGSGYETVPRLIFGAERAARGQLTIAGRSYALAKMRPDRAVRVGVAYVPADRTREGAILGLEAWENLSMLALGRGWQTVFIRRRRLIAESQVFMSEFAVNPSDPRLTVRSLSGGNQQKVLLAKWLRTKPMLILLNEPTQGVDVGARAYIFRLLREAADAGACVVCASGDQAEVAALCDRALVFGAGAIQHEVSYQEMSKDNLIEKSYSAASTRGVA